MVIAKIFLGCAPCQAQHCTTGGMCVRHNAISQRRYSGQGLGICEAARSTALAAPCTQTVSDIMSLRFVSDVLKARRGIDWGPDALLPMVYCSPQRDRQNDRRGLQCRRIGKHQNMGKATGHKGIQLGPTDRDKSAMATTILTGAGVIAEWRLLVGVRYLE